MNSEQAANILAFYSYYHPKETVSQIALDFKVPAAIIINGLYYGERVGLFTAKKKGPQYQEIIVKAVPDDNADFGKDLERVKNNIYEVITNLNSDEEDITDDNLFIWLGVPFVAAKTALQLLVNEGKLVKYRIIDPKDKKSIYHFYTLTENKDKFYGNKQFKKARRKDVKTDEQLPQRKRRRPAL
jgi:hypothetical protein